MSEEAGREVPAGAADAAPSTPATAAVRPGVPAKPASVVARLSAKLLPVGPVKKAGYLLKKGTLTWSKRYFALDGPVLTYRNSEKMDGAKATTIQLDARSSLTELDPAVFGKVRAFRVTTTEREYLLRAETDAEYGAWVEAIRASLRGKTEVPERPSDEVLQARFRDLMADANLPESTRKHMSLTMSADTKWMMIIQEEEKRSKMDSPEFWMSKLRDKAGSAEALESLRQTLHSANVSWVIKFVELGGVRLIVQSIARPAGPGARPTAVTPVSSAGSASSLASSSAATAQQGRGRASSAARSHRAPLEAARCLRAIMNADTRAIQAVASEPGAVRGLVALLHEYNDDIRAIAAEVLTGVCLFPAEAELVSGHSLVVDGLASVASEMRHGSRYQVLTFILSSPATTSAACKVKVLMLVNALIRTPPELSRRFQIRQELFRLGLSECVQRLKASTELALQEQVRVYLEDLEDDEEEARETVFEGLDILALEGVDDIVGAVRDKVQGTECYDQFVFALRFLATIPAGVNGLPPWIAVNEAIRATLTQDINHDDDDAAAAIGPTPSTPVGRPGANAKKAGDKGDAGDGDDGQRAAPVPVPVDNRAMQDEVARLTAALASQAELVAAQTEELLVLRQKVYDLEKSDEEEEEVEDSKSGGGGASAKVPKQVEKEDAAHPPREEALLKEIDALKAEIETLKARPVRAAPPAPPPKKDDGAAEGGAPVVAAAPAVAVGEAPVATGPPPPPPPPGGGGPKPPAPPPPPPGSSSTTGGGGGGGPPPPPPPPGGGGPPPPPPPPGSGGSGGGPPPPPPPPGGGPPKGPPPPPGAPKPPGAPAAPAGLPPKKTITPKAPMKKINWNKIANAEVAKTVWGKATDENVKFDEDQFVDLFANAPPASAAAGADGASAAAASAAAADKGPKKPAVVSLLDMQRANNVGIMLSRFKMPFPEIRVALLAMDESRLTVQHLRSLAQYAPTADEIEMIKEFDGDKATLGQAERFFLEIMDIPNLGPRLQAAIFRDAFEGLVMEVEPELQAVDAACKGLRSSKAFLRLLEVVLALGNYMNGGSFRGGAYGVKLDALLKLGDTRAADRKTTLLHFVVLHAEKRDPAVLALPEELAAMEPASRISFNTIQSEVAELRKGLALVAKQLGIPTDEERQRMEQEEKEKAEAAAAAAAAAAEEGADPSSTPVAAAAAAAAPKPKPAAASAPKIAGDRFHEVMTDFYTRAKKRFDGIVERVAKLEAAYRADAAYFGEDGAVMGPDEFFGLLNTFVASFSRAHKEILADREAEEKKQRMAQAKLNAKPSGGAAPKDGGEAGAGAGGGSAGAGGVGGRRPPPGPPQIQLPMAGLGPGMLRKTPKPGDPAASPSAGGEPPATAAAPAPTTTSADGEPGKVGAMDNLLATMQQRSRSERLKKTSSGNLKTAANAVMLLNMSQGALNKRKSILRPMEGAE